MKISGFTIVRNGLRMDYPFVESICSLLPLVDEMVVAVGDSNDGTENTLEDLRARYPHKLRLIASPWDPANLSQGLELARQTNIALEACSHNICFYLQADEVLLDSEYERLRLDLSRFEQDEEVDALLLNWVHFYGGYYTVIHSKRWYRREIRVLKKDRGFRSFGDAQSFRLWNELEGTLHKSRAALSQAHVFHYGWAKEETLMKAKFAELGRYWGRDPDVVKADPAPFYQNQFGLKIFEGPHPEIMVSRAGLRPRESPRWMSLQAVKNFNYWRYRVTNWLEQRFDWRPGEFRSYRSLKKY
jgi:glycosyltransferase involved in cell wall biosynthesis